jgi:hypothetical protein
MPPWRLRRAPQQAARGDSPAPAAQQAWRRRAWHVLALWALDLAAYANSFQSGLVFDNATAIMGDTF